MLRTAVKPEIKTLLSLAAPIIASQLLQISTMVIDTLMAGRANATELAGVAVGGSLWMPLFLFLIGVLSALSPTVAQLAGRSALDEIAHPVAQVFWKMLLLLPLGFLLAWLCVPLFQLMRVDEAILPVASGYFRAMIWGLPAILAFNVLRYYSDGLSLTKPAMYASLLGLVVNAPLNYIFIFGKLGVPAMGGVGCGWASAISFWVMFLFMLVWVRWRPEYRSTYLFKQLYRPEKAAMMGLFKIGLPIGFSFLIESSVFSLIALFLSVFGALQVASHQIALSVAGLVFMIPLSLSMALTIRVGQLIGAGNYHYARFAGYLGIGLALIYGALSAILLTLFSRGIAMLYNDQLEVIELAAQLLILAGVFQLGDAVQVSCAGILRGYKDTKIPMVITFVAFWLVALPLGYYLGMHGLGFAGYDRPLQAKGFWIALIAGLWLVSSLLLYRFLSLSRREIGRHPGAGSPLLQAESVPLG